MQAYVNLLKDVMIFGEDRADRTGVGTRSVFGGQIEFDLRQSFPVVTIKETRWHTAFIEMLWFLRGEPNTDYLHQHGVHIWDSWADAKGNLGPIYGVQWRKWPVDSNFTATIDQVRNLIDGLRKNPIGRRHIVTAWNPTFVPMMGLPPCHRDFQCYVTNGGQLDLMVAIRSWDLALGAPFNIAQYGLLTHLIARAAGYTARRLIINYGDAHIYQNHLQVISDLLGNEKPRAPTAQLVIGTDNTDIDGYQPGDFFVSNYECGPFLKLPIAV
jgi:thymidylate synthase